MSEVSKTFQAMMFGITPSAISSQEIAGWSLALRYAGWPNERPVWTGSCPCQPFSSAGKRQGATDERHLWPAFQQLIAQCRPPTVFGEQVASKDGREWLSAVRYDLESLGYACGAADLPAAGVGAPHIRQRLWWVAESSSQHGREGKGREYWQETGNSSIVGNAEGDDEQRPRKSCPSDGRQGEAGGSGAWSSVEYIPCADGKARPTKPGILPLADRVPGRVGRMCAYGNAIVPASSGGIHSGSHGRNGGDGKLPLQNRRRQPHERGKR